MKAIRIEKLEKKFNEKVAVNKIDLEIEENELFSLLGVNGAGKTTTIKILTGILKPTSGNAYLEGLSILEDMDKIKEFINVSPQETAIAGNLTVKENLELIFDIYEIKDNKKATINDLLEKFYLKEYGNIKAVKLSGGYQRRLSLAMALITSPRILFLDEPTLGLDVLARRELWKIIEGLKKTTTIVLTTHYMEEAEFLSDRVAVMCDGVVIDVGTPKELIKKTKAKNFEDAFVKLVTKEEIK